MRKFKFHISLHVSNMEKTVNFYKRLFGQNPEKTKPGYSKFELENPGLVISFIESKEQSPHFGHMGIRVNSHNELVQKKKEIKSLINIELEENNTSCCYAIQDKFWVKDPDGYEWEVYHFLKDDESIGGKQLSGKELVGCC